VIVAPADSQEHDLTSADLQGKNVAATIGYTYGEPFQSDPTVDKDFVQSDVAILRLVANKRAAYGVIFDMVMNNLVAEHPEELAGKIKIVGILSRQDLYISFSLRHPGAKEAAALIDRGLARIKADGTYRRLEESWQSRILSQ
jgi:polar amino acid transport system substrate-binding protein